MHRLSLLASLGALASTSLATPTPVQRRQESSAGAQAYDEVLASLRAINPNPAPTSSSEANVFSRLQDAFQPLESNRQGNLFKAAGEVYSQGLTSNGLEDTINFIEGVLTGENSDNNANIRNPSSPVFPQAGPNDAPYSLTEDELRRAIFIPEDFQFGRDGAPQPVILVPGTGNTGFITFSGNYIPLLRNSGTGDPVWLNIPGFLLGDVQVHAEYVAYAINYIQGISNNRNVAVFGWSQGNIIAQWAYKYWPSTRSKVTDHVAVSADYDGTILANFLAAPGIPLPPAFLQQAAGSAIIRTLNANGGGNAYVPTTSTYSGFLDEIVQPQTGLIASARINPARGFGTTNAEVQLVCALQPGGTFYTHEGTLYNPLAWELAKDALARNGPGLVRNINRRGTCARYLAEGLDLVNLLLTENAIFVAGLATVLTPNKVFDEPPIKEYARLPFI